MFSGLYHMEIASGLLSRDDYLRAIAQAVEFLRSNGIPEVLVAYGWSCECPEDRLYQDIAMPLDRLQSFITESEAVNYYQVGQNDLHVSDAGARCRFLFCHESDIHFITEDESLFQNLAAIWVANGYKDVYEKRGADWQRVASSAQ
jgi:hypothetical protein